MRTLSIAVAHLVRAIAFGVSAARNRNIKRTKYRLLPSSPIIRDISKPIAVSRAQKRLPCTLGPGLSPGTLNIEGNFEQTAGGTFLVEIFGDTVFDQLFATGSGLLGGALQVDVITGASFEVDDVFSIMNFNPNSAPSLSGTFDSVTGSGASFFDLVYGPDSLSLVANQSFESSAVSAPGAVTLLAVGAVYVFRRRRDRGC